MNLEQQKERALTSLRGLEKPDATSYQDLLADDFEFEMMGRLPGIAPMRVYLGFASGVQLEINNRTVAIGPQFMAGDVARFEAGADGVLRRDSRGGAAARATGVIVDQLGNGYWRVKWSNNDAPMTHRGHSLKRLQAPLAPGGA